MENAGAGCQIILVNPAGSVLLQLRDDIPSIPFPGMWALPGGMLEPGELPLDCILREVDEELGARLAAGTVTHVVSKTRSYGLEHTFTAPFAATVDEIDLTEGQRVEWFTPEQIESLDLAYEDDQVLESFFAARS